MLLNQQDKTALKTITEASSQTFLCIDLSYNVHVFLLLFLFLIKVSLSWALV